MKAAQVLIAGGGIVGLATAWRILQRFPGHGLQLLEKESGLARHQTGHNSGVLHSGIYYRSGSRKAELCRRGHSQMVAFCGRHAVPHELCGKLIIAVSEAEKPRLEALRLKAEANGIPGVKLLSLEAIRDFEPHAAGLQALHVPGAGIVDYRTVAEKLAEEIRRMGGEILTGQSISELRTLREGKLIRAGEAEFRADFFINCGGLQSDRIAKMDGLDPGLAIVPFRGEYYELKPEAAKLVRNLIYPVPDPAFPFLGVHFTRMIRGGVECGPNAVLSLKREGYHKSDISLRDLWETLSLPGFRRLARRHWRMGLDELRRSFSKAAFARALQRLVPETREDMLVRAEAGVRAQALRNDGSLEDDFAFAEGPRSLHVLNAPSPAATASLAIGEEIAARYAGMAGL